MNERISLKLNRLIAFASPALAGLQLLFLQSGCTVGPNYQTPRLTARPAWSSPLPGGETNSAVVDDCWWKSFRDAELDALIRRAGQSNLTLHIAESRVREARAQRGIVATESGPQIDALGAYSRNLWDNNSFPQLPSGTQFNYDLYTAGFDAAWEWDVFGGTRRSVQAANAAIAVAECNREDVLRSLLAEVARNYVDARAFQTRLEIASNNIAAQREIVQRTRDRQHAGLTTELDVQQADALLAATEAQVPTLAAGFRTAVYQLDVLLGQPPGHLLAELSRPGSLPVAPPAVPVGLPSDLLQRRPDIRASENQLIAATARIGIAKSDLFPKFSLTGGIGLQSISAGDWWTAGSKYWSAGPTITWPVFASGRIHANIRVQTARQEQALASYELTVLTAFGEVEKALTAYANEQVRRQSLAESAQANQHALSLANDLYGNGLTDFLRVLTSQRGFYESQDSLVQSDQAIALNLIALYKALGGGWANETGINSMLVSTNSK